MTNEEFRRSFKVPHHNNLGLAVYSCGVQRCAAGHSWGPAIRDHYLIHYIVSGCGVFSVKGNEYNLSVGDGFLVVPSCVASYAADTEEPWEYCWVGFNGSDAKQLVDQTGLNEENPVFHYEHDGKLEGLLTDICNVSGSTPAAEARMLGGLYLFMAELIDHLGNASTQRTTGYEYVQKAIKFIDYNYSRDIDIEDVAESAGISRSHLYRIFMQHVSMPPNEYLMRYRINKAAALLKAGNLSRRRGRLFHWFFRSAVFFACFQTAHGGSPQPLSESKKE